VSKLNVVTEFIGSTLRATLVTSGATISPLSTALYDKNDVLVTSISMASSGNGFYYGDIPLPNSAQWMLNEFVAVINANTYRRFQLVNVLKPEVD
jgi:H+/gluconate symporter-like permease